MKNTIELAKGVLVFYIIAIAVIIITADDIQIHSTQVIQSNSNTYILPLLRQPSFYFNDILENAADHEYILDEYDCTEFSRNLTWQLNSHGWDAEMVMVIINCNSTLWNTTSCNKSEGRHDLVRLDEVYIEATLGEVIPPAYYADYGIDGG